MYKEEYLEVYSSSGEKIAGHHLAEKGRKERYVGKPQKTAKKRDVDLPPPRLCPGDGGVYRSGEAPQTLLLEASPEKAAGPEGELPR